MIIKQFRKGWSLGPAKGGQFTPAEGGQFSPARGWSFCSGERWSFWPFFPERWVKIFKYKGDWILFNDIPKYLLTDSCLITFQMDDPVSSVIVDYKPENNKYKYSLLSYNWENPTINQKYDLQIKLIDSKRLIALWRFEFQGQVTYDLMIPINQVSHFPAMVMLETDLMDDENEIFDKIDYEELWNK